MYKFIENKDNKRKKNPQKQGVKEFLLLILGVFK